MKPVPWPLLRPVARQARQALRAGPGRACAAAGRTAATAAPGEEPPTFARFPEGALPGGFVRYALQAAWDVSPDSRLLRYDLPEGVRSLAALGAPAGVKVRREIGGQLLDKSYSPVSHAAAEGHVDLLVKRYAARPGGGLGTFLCDMKPGETVEMKLKAPRNLGATPYVANRFADVVLLGAGTGVAPLLQLARVILQDPGDRSCVHFVAAHRSERDVLLHDWMEEWSARFPERFRAHVALSQPESADRWLAQSGRTVGRIDLACLRDFLPRPSASCVVLVCGTDSFLEHVCGAHTRVADPAGGKARKLQGPVRGLLAQLGFGSSAGDTVVKL